MRIRDVLDRNGLLRDEHLGRLCPGIGVGVLVFGDGRFPELGDVGDGRRRFLMGLRGPLRSDDHPGGVRNEPFCWDIPGGGVNMDERLADVAVRETVEELGVIVASVEPLFVIEHFPEGQHWVSHTFGAVLAGNSPMPAVPEEEREKCLQLHYFTHDEAMRLPQDELTTSMLLNLPRMADLGLS